MHTELDQLVQQLSENVIGGFALPFGIVPDVPINQKNYILPLAVEETSIVAGLCKMAKWIRQDGEVITSQTEQSVMGQVYFSDIKDKQNFIKYLEQEKQNLINSINKNVVSGMVKRGGGVTDFKVRWLGDHQVVIDIYLQPVMRWVLT